MTNRQIVTIPQHGSSIVRRDGLGPSSNMLLWMDEIVLKVNLYMLGDRVVPPEYEVADLPDPTDGNGLIFVTDESGGPVIAYSDLSNWRRVSDGAVVT